MKNMSETIVDTTKAALILYQVARQVSFHPDELAFSLPLPINSEVWNAPPSGAGASHALT